MEKKEQLLQSIIDGIQEKKGANITTINLKNISGSVCDYFVICDGNTPTQVSAIAESVEDFAKKQTGESPIRIHGLQQSEWVAIDYGNIIVHVFVPQLREFYNMQNLWDDAITEQIDTVC